MKPAPTDLEGLCERHGLDERQGRRLTAILDRLASDETAPTSAKAQEEALDVHLADSLSGLELAEVREAPKIVDVGAGAGFPGLPLAVALPASQMTLVDSQARKCAFMEGVVEGADVANASVVCARVEEWPEGIGAYDAVLARALAPPAVVLEYAAPLLKLGGALIDWRGRRHEVEEEAALAAAAELGLERLAIHRAVPFPDAHSRHLHVYRKARETPDRFPRRAGMARKRPLA